jgi:hypothetical protein
MDPIDNPFSRRQFMKRLLAVAGGAGAVQLAQFLRLPGASDLAADAQGIPDRPVYLPLVTNAGNFGARVLQVGPARRYRAPSAAAADARDGDVVEIDAGLYPADVATWRQNGLTLRGVGGRAHLDAQGANAGGKATWVIQGNNTLVENIEFSGASVPDQNGAGIRQEGANLTVRGCYFHDNEEGILAGDNASSEITIEYSEFGYNGFGDGYTHNLYINHVARFTLQYCYSHHAKIGHLVKSRAYENHILYNRLMDEAAGTASYEIDLPDGGLAYVIGNLIQQGPATDNPTMVTFAEESSHNPAQEIYLVNNTLVNDRPTGGTFFRAGGSAAAVNNLFVGPGTLFSGSVSANANLTLGGDTLVNRATYDYHLAPASTARHAGADPGSAHGLSLTPLWQYVHPEAREPRTNSGALDVGAYAG